MVRADLLDDHRRQPLGRLVEQQQPRAGAQDAADGQHLLLAARELGPLAAQPLAQVREQLEDRVERRARPARTRGGSRRFSSTLRLAKMPRSSGQKAMPEPGDGVGRPARSARRRRSAPSRVAGATMPMTDLSVVVLPAPLRPSSVTTSPARTSKSTPCRMWDSPYQACRSRTQRSERAQTCGRCPCRPGSRRDCATPSA